MTDKKPGFFQRLFGIGGDKPKPAEPAPRPVKEPPSDKPKREPPADTPAKKEPPKDRPAKQQPPDRKKPAKKAAKPKPSAKPKGPPPAGPAARPGEAPPEERPPSEREKPAPGENKPAPIPAETAPKPKARPVATPATAPPPAGPGPAPGAKPTEDLPPAEREKDKPKSIGEPKRSWFEQLRQGLARTSDALSDNLGALARRKLDEDTLDELEEALIKADLGVAMAGRIRARIAKGRYDRGLDADEVRDILADEIARVLDPLAAPFEIAPGERPHVYLVVGVNGTGKTTTIGKMAHQFKRRGLSVMLAAADTFRAAAIDQLKVWGERVGAEVVAKDVGTDPAGVAFEALERARADGTDVLLIDSAGRLQNKQDLMAELAKIVRVLKKLDQSTPHGVILVLDATTGQNALSQVEIFKEIAGVTGIVVTKLDGTARGGILVAIAERFKLPINAIGIGESLDDLKPFDARDFARAIAGARRENEAAA
jgi:fused signal recognition particle receptor